MRDIRGIGLMGMGEEVKRGIDLVVSWVDMKVGAGVFNHGFE